MKEKTKLKRLFDASIIALMVTALFAAFYCITIFIETGEGGYDLAITIALFLAMTIHEYFKVKK